MPKARKAGKAGKAPISSVRPAPRSPQAFDAQTPRSLSPDLARGGDAAPSAEVRPPGPDEARETNAVVTRADFLRLVDNQRPILEIGPYPRSAFTGDGVTRAAALSPDQVRDLLAAQGQPADGLPSIDVITPRHDLAAVDGRFRAIVSNHDLDHQPNLLGTLRHLDRLLLPGGTAVVFLPDRRYCFARFMPEPTLDDVLAADRERRRHQTARTLVEHLTLETHNDPVRHWRGDHGEPAGASPNRLAQAAALHRASRSHDHYHDIKAWHFDPDGFAAILGGLRARGLLRLETVAVYPTPRDTLEFWVVLRKPLDATGDPPSPVPPSVGGQGSVAGLWFDATGWVPTDLPGHYHAPTAAPDPRLLVHLPHVDACRLRGTLTLSATLLDLVEVAFVGSAGSRPTLLLDLLNPHLVLHDLPFALVDPDAEAGACRISFDLQLGHGERLERLEIALRDPGGLRIHPCVLPPELAEQPEALPGARLAIVGATLEETQTLREGRPFRGSASLFVPEVTKVGRLLRDAVFFSSAVPDERALRVGEQFLDMLARHHRDSKIFVGVQRGSLPAWTETVVASGLDVEICPVAEEVDIASDAAGHFAALDRLRSWEEPFDLVWFGHTKGAINGHDVWARHYAESRLAIERRFWGRRDMVERAFADPKIGLWAPCYLAGRRIGELWPSIFRELAPEHPVPPGIMTVGSFFVTRDAVVREFLRRVPPNVIIPADDPAAQHRLRFFFEFGLSNVPPMLGYDVHIERGNGRTTLPATAEIGRSVFADEPQNHLLLRRRIAAWRVNPAAWQGVAANPAVHVHELPDIFRGRGSGSPDDI